MEVSPNILAYTCLIPHESHMEVSPNILAYTCLIPHENHMEVSPTHSLMISGLMNLSSLENEERSFMNP